MLLHHQVGRHHTQQYRQCVLPLHQVRPSSLQGKNKYNFRKIVLDKFESISERIEKRFDESEEKEKVLVETEKKKVEILEEIAADTKKLTSTFIEYLNKKQ